MKESAFEGIVTAIPILILLVAIILPFSAHGWDVMGTVLPANPFLGMGSGLMPGIGGGGKVTQQGPMVSIVGSGLTADGSRFFLDVQLKNPMPMEVEVKEFSGSIPAGGTMVDLSLARPVTIPSGGTVLTRLEGPRPQGVSTQGASSPSPSDLANLRMTLSAGGIDMNLDENAIRGMIS